MAGKISLCIGPMWAQKTTWLIQNIRRESVVGRKILVIKYKGDTRYSSLEISSHNLEKIKAHGCSKLNELYEEGLKHDVIAIDEGQFFVDLIECCEHWANNGKLVFVAALDADFRGLPFGQTCDLVARAEEVIKLKAICLECKAEASFSQKIYEKIEKKSEKKSEKSVMGEKSVTGEKSATIDVGGAEKYRSACRACFNRK